MISNLFVLFILVLSTSTQPVELTSLTLHEQGIKINNEGQYSRLILNCQARVGQCSFQYTLLPPAWRIAGNDLLAPTSDIASIKSFRVQATISEPTGESMVRDIVIDFEDGVAKLRSRLLQSSNGRKQQKAEIRQRPQQVTSSISRIYRNQLGETYLEQKGIVSSLPTIARLDKIIVDADEFLISSNIQSIIQSKQQCSAKLQYLNSVIKRISQHINFNTKQLQKEELNIQATQATLNNLSQQKQRLTSQVSAMPNKRQLELQVSQLAILKQEYKSKYFTSNIIANQYLTRFKKALGNDAVSAQKLKEVDQQLQKDEKDLEDINKQINNLMDLKNSLQRRIQKNRKIIDDSVNAGVPSPQNLNNLETNFKKYSNSAADFKQKERQTMSQLTIAQAQLESISGRYDDLTKRIEEIDQQLKQGTQNNLSRDSKEIKTRVDTLERNLPKLKNQLEKCEKQKQEAEATKQPNSVVFFTNPNQVAFREILNRERIKSLRVEQDSKTPINIFSSNWIRNYGVPNTYSFRCSNAGGLVSGYGIVTGITGGSIKVKGENGNIYTLHIGICSQILGSNSSLAPKMGDIVDWTGKPLTFNIYNVYRVVFHSLDQ